MKDIKEFLELRFKQILENPLKTKQHEAFVVGCLMGLVYEIIRSEDLR